jgi:CBS-domain-containing membrane protein
MIPAAVKQDEFFLIAVKQMARYELQFIPVINNEHQLIGKIDISRLLPTLSTFVGADEPGGMIVLEMDQRNFSFGEISRLVETNDAQITQLNTFVHPSTGMLQITLQLSTQEVSDVVATFQRYEYHVVFYMGEEQYTNELKENYHHLMNYLNI